MPYPWIMRALRSLLACALALLLVGEASGVARAFGRGASVACCCGAHFAARPCPCPDCPSSTQRALTRAPSGARVDAGHACDGAGSDPAGVLQVLATLPAAPALAAAPAARPSVLVRRAEPRGRIVELDRPPP